MDPQSSRGASSSVHSFHEVQPTTSSWTAPTPSTWTAPTPSTWTAPTPSSWTAPTPSSWTAPTPSSWTVPTPSSWTAPTPSSWTALTTHHTTCLLPASVSSNVSTQGNMGLRKASKEFHWNASLHMLSNHHSTASMNSIKL